MKAEDAPGAVRQLRLMMQFLATTAKAPDEANTLPVSTICNLAHIGSPESRVRLIRLTRHALRVMESDDPGAITQVDQLDPDLQTLLKRLKQRGHDARRQAAQA